MYIQMIHVIYTHIYKYNKVDICIYIHIYIYNRVDIYVYMCVCVCVCKTDSLCHAPETNTTL